MTRRPPHSVMNTVLGLLEDGEPVSVATMKSCAYGSAPPAKPDESIRKLVQRIRVRLDRQGNGQRVVALGAGLYRITADPSAPSTVAVRPTRADGVLARIGAGARNR